MKLIKSLCSFFLLFSSCQGIDYTPWFPPPFQIQSRLSGFYESVNRVSTPNGTFVAHSQNASLQLGCNLTPWPFWNVEAEILLTHSEDIAFAYESANFSLRYAWLDDIAGDPFTLVTGSGLYFPSGRFLKNLSFDYHGRVNAEFYAALGKEFSYSADWLFRLWGMGGYGVANRGSPWLHGLAVLESKPTWFLECGFFTEAIYGLGNKDLSLDRPFNGYASINHQAIDIGGYLNSPLGYLGTLSVMGWYNVHARNFISHYWGLGISLLVPFSIFDLPISI